MLHSFHHLMMCTYLTFQKKVFSRTAPLSLMPGQPKILDFLKFHNECEQKDIAKGCCLEPATVTSLLGRMEQAELISRKQLNGNRRSSHVSLTPKGEQMYEKTKKIFEICESMAFQGFSEEEKKTFIEMLERIYQNLEQEDKNA